MTRARLAPTLAALDLGPGYEIVVCGESETSGDVNAKLAAGLPAALSIMLAALVFQFKSARRVGLTLMTIPLILVGAPLALSLTGQPLSFFAIRGLISLMVGGLLLASPLTLLLVPVVYRAMFLGEAVRAPQATAA